MSTKPPPLTYVSEQDHAWAMSLREADSLPAIRALCDDWGEWVPDARAVVATLDEDGFRTFRKGLLAKTDDIQWIGRFGAIALPQRLLEISLIAHQFKAPFGCAAIRYQQLEPKKGAWVAKVPQ